MLYLEGPLGSGKTSRLLAEAAQLLTKAPASSVLVLCSNHTRQQAFIERLLTRIGAPLAQLPVYTYAGFVRNALFNYWPLVEAEIVATLKRGSPRIRPELSGLEDTELMLKWLLARLRQDAQVNGQAVFEDFPGSDKHILKQIVRRLRLRSENQLSRKDMLERSALLEEMCQTETAWLEKQFDIDSYRLRVLDPNKQLDIFNSLLKRDNALSAGLKQEIRHLIVDDVDETIVAQQRLIEFLAPGLETLMLAADIDGGSRRGYLNAYPYDWSALKALRPGKTEVLTRTDTPYQAGQTLLANWKAQDGFKPLPPMVQMNDRFITRVEMLEQVVDDVMALLEVGYHPGDFCLVLPKTDFLSFYQLQTRFSQSGIPTQLLSGTKRPSDNPKCKAFLYLLQWANAPQWKVALSPWEIKTVLMQALEMHQLPGMQGESLDKLVNAIHDYGKVQESAQGDLLAALAIIPSLDDLKAQPELEPIVTGYVSQRYGLLAAWLDKARRQTFEEQLYSVFKDLFTRFSSERDGYGDLNRIIQSYLRQKDMYDGFWGLNPDAEPAMGGSDFNRWWLEQVKSGTMADTPERPEAINPEALLIGTPQKVIDTELYSKVQFWLDVGSREWARSDNAPLYNAWVHSAVWDGSSAAFSEEFNEAVIRTRAGHITRSLMLLATERVQAYASELDDLGGSQIGLLKPRLLTEMTKTVGILERATLRSDQAPILAYQSGTMAISAVPGAGKTFVNVELLLELIERGLEPDRILVLTYMDSAAKTLLGRLKKKLAGITNKLPVVSTIHSLAFRILTENDHALLTGILPDDMTILDDFGRGDILGKVAVATQPESSKNINDWQRAIDRGVNHCKMFDIEPESIKEQLKRVPGSFRLAEFLPALQIYDQLMRQNGFLDFTDLITKAVGILRHYPDIREKYQKQFAIIIEDEAQDSSRLLQEFIHLLGGDKPNLIRTGDTNQSITTTFSSADTGVFRGFVQSAKKTVQMDRSGRCAPEIIALANYWMLAAAELPGLEQAFEPVQMLPVEGQNPSLLYAPSAQLFDVDAQEQDWLVTRIKEIRAERPDAAIAVLVRGNQQVNQVTAMLQQAQVSAVSLSDKLNVSPVFTFIVSYLKLLANPADLELQNQWCKQMVENQLVDDCESRRLFLASTPLFYQEPANLPDETLKQWVYDWLDLRRQAAGGNISTLIARLTDRFFYSVSDRSNGYLCALMAQDILNDFQHVVNLSPLEIVIHQFDAFQRSWRGKKGFGDVLLQHASQVVQVMTIHKSKGQEFDVVFMPFMQTDSMPHETGSIRFDEADKLIQDLDRLVSGATQFQPEAYELGKKREKIEEEARLIYVGLTRAKRALYLTAHQQGMKFNRLRKSEPAAAYHILSQYLSTPSDVKSLSEELKEVVSEVPPTEAIQELPHV